MTSYQTIETSLLDHIATITLNRPERRNAISGRMAGELLHVLDEFDREDEIRVLVATQADGLPPVAGEGDGEALP